MFNGFYKMNRGWMFHPLFSRDKAFDTRSAWAFLIESACFKMARYNCLGSVVSVERGSFFTTRKELSRIFNWSERSVRTFLTRLEKEEMIELKTDQGKTQIFIMNYDTYQFTGPESGQAETRERPTKERSKINKGNKTPDFFKQGLSTDYPRRNTRLDFLGAYRKIMTKVEKGDITYEDFFRACRNYKKECERLNTDRKFIKCPKTFANGSFETYLDAEDERQATSELKSLQEWTAF